MGFFFFILFLNHITIKIECGKDANCYTLLKFFQTFYLTKKNVWWFRGIRHTYYYTCVNCTV